MKVVLGKKYKDNITGYIGVATARSEYLYGCIRVLLESTKLKKDGDFINDFWVDEARLITVKGATFKRSPKEPPMGSGKIAPARDAKRFQSQPFYNR